MDDNNREHELYGYDHTVEIKNEKSYVTRKAFIILLVATLLVGGAMGYLLALTSNEPTSSSTNYTTVSDSNTSLDSATDSELSIQQIVAKNENSVVEISTESVVTDTWLGSYITEGAGSGVIVREDGYIVTNNHVVEDSNKIEVTLYDGTTYEAEIVGTDTLNDIAIIKIDAAGLDPVEYGDLDLLEVGDLAVAIGNPLGELGGTATTGIISSLDRAIEIDGLTLNLLQTDAAINPGNSGGGLFDEYGNLIGIVVAKSGGSDVEGLAFAIPITTAEPIIEDLIENGKITDRPVAGITIVDISEAEASQYGVEDPGVYIYEVTGDNANKAGLKSGDYVTYLDDVEITSSSQLISEIQKNEIGDTVTFTITRDGKKMEISVELEDSAKYN